MRAAGLVFLACCGYPSLPAVGRDALDAGNDAPPDAAVQTCWKFADTSDGTDWSACTLHAIGPALDIAANKVIDTDAATDCAIVEVDVKTGATTEVAEVCALFASSISIHVGATLSAHGALSLALFAPTIDVQGTIDIASHIGGQRGAGSNTLGCNPASASTGGGGGAGGTWNITGGTGGDQGGGAGTGGQVEHAITAALLRGGCDGRRGGDGTASGGDDIDGGMAGGAVWLAADDSTDGAAVASGTIKLGPTSVINASGAGGAGGAIGNRGGSGGGGGGLIVLQAKTIAQDPGTKIFSNGGHGGGGSSAGTAGTAGADPTSPKSIGTGGNGGDDAGSGGQGYPATGINEMGLSGGSTSGGGGGGGGGGVIRVDTGSLLGSSSFSPPYRSAVTQ